MITNKQHEVTVPSHRDPNRVFDAAIRKGILSLSPEADNYAADWMYMGDDREGRAMFKSVITRAYMPAVKVDIYEPDHRTADEIDNLDNFGG